MNFTTDAKKITFYENIELISTGFAKQMCDRFMFSLNPFNGTKGVARKYKTRNNPFQINRGYLDIDTSVFELPKNYTVEAIPNSSEIVTDFGSYTLNFEVEEGKAYCKQVISINFRKVL